MRTFLVVSNTSFTTICRAEGPDNAVLLAKSLYANKYGAGADDIGLEAYSTENYFENHECIEIKFQD